MRIGSSSNRIVRKVAFLLLLLWPHDAVTSTAQDILRQADQARGNLDGIAWEVVLESVEPTKTRTMTFEIKARGFDILGQNLAPPKYKGNKILMLSGNMWFYKPSLSKPVPISRRQRLLGTAAYGDIAATNYAQDYEARELASEEVNGETCYVFDLTSKDSQATYDRIKYWISQDRLVGVKAEYFTVSGKKVKSATMDYANTVTIQDETRPFISRMVIRDELLSSQVTTLTFQHPNTQALPYALFDLNLLRK